MDVFQKILTKVYETSEGKDSVDVDLVDLLKREGFYGNLEGISRRLIDESWVAETPRQYTVRLTHWGAGEAKRLLTNQPDFKTLVAKDANRLLNETREFMIMLEEFAANPSKEKLDTIGKRHSDIGKIVERLDGNL
jgi:hypothetical protein